MTVFLQVSFRSSNSRSEAKCARIIPVTKMILYYVSQSLYACEKTMLRVGNWANSLVLHCTVQKKHVVSLHRAKSITVYFHTVQPLQRSGSLGLNTTTTQLESPYPNRYYCTSATEKTHFTSTSLHKNAYNPWPSSSFFLPPLYPDLYVHLISFPSFRIKPISS